GFGALAAAARRPADAARLWGAGEAALEALGTQLWPANRPDHERWRARARSRLPAAGFDGAGREGRALPLAQAAGCALEGWTAGAARSAPVRAWEPRLPAREREVAHLAARGLTNRQVAEVLVIAEKTVANHMQRVLDKLNLHSRTQLAVRAAEFGL